jgi:hypothetical protein
MHLFLLHVLYAVLCLSNSCAVTIIAKKKTCSKGEKMKNTAQHRLETNVRARGFNAGLLATSQFASGRSCDLPNRSRFSVVFLGLRAYAELVPKFHVVLPASRAALPTVTLKISPYTNITLTFDFDFGLDHIVHGGYG